MAYPMQFLKFLYFLTKTWTIVCYFRSFFPFSKNMDYHMQFLKCFCPLQKFGLSYAIYIISFPSPKTWAIICNFKIFFLFSKNMDYHMRILEFLSLLQNGGLSYAIYKYFFLLSKNMD